MRGRMLLALLPAAGVIAACEAATGPAMEPEVLQAAREGAGSMVPYADRQAFAIAPGSGQVICTPTQFGAGPPDLYHSSGVSSHMGRTTGVLQFEACALDLTQVAWFTATGTIVSTAANGDELWGEFSMTQYENGDFTIDEVAFTGGTGRFTGATGTAAGSGWIDRDTYAGYWTASGLLSKPGR